FRMPLQKYCFSVYPASFPQLPSQFNALPNMKALTFICDFIILYNIYLVNEVSSLPSHFFLTISLKKISSQTKDIFSRIFLISSIQKRIYLPDKKLLHTLYSIHFAP